MQTLRVNDLLKDRILVSRESAHLLADALRALVEGMTTTAATIDFARVEGMAPSFLDELLTVLETHLKSAAKDVPRSLVVANPPTRLSLKFVAVARGHALTVQERPDGSWLLSSAGTPDSQE